MTKREDLFVITKIADIHHDRVSESQQHQLNLLGLEYSGRKIPGFPNPDGFLTYFHEFSDLLILETPWELEARDNDKINGEYKTDSGEESIITGGNGIPFKKVTKLTETWHQMERLVTQGLVKVRKWSLNTISLPL